MKLIYSIFLALLGFSAFASSELEAPPTKTLNFKNFRSSVTNGDAWMVKFTTKWCGHCKTLAPIWDTLAIQYENEIRPDGTKVHFVNVDCTNKNILCDKYNITGYPTIRFFHNAAKLDLGPRDLKDIPNKAVDIGERSHANFEIYLHKMLENVIYVGSKDEFEKKCNHGTGNFVFLNPNDLQIKLFSELAAKHKSEITFIIAKTDELFEELSAKNRIHVNHYEDAAINTNDSPRLFFLNNDTLIEYGGSLDHVEGIHRWTDVFLAPNYQKGITFDENSIPIFKSLNKKVVMSAKHVLEAFFGFSTVYDRIDPLAKYIVYPEAENLDLDHIKDLKGKYAFATIMYNEYDHNTLYTQFDLDFSGFIVWDPRTENNEYYQFKQEHAQLIKDEYGYEFAETLMNEDGNYVRSRFGAVDLSYFLRAIEDGKIETVGRSYYDMAKKEFRALKLKYKAAKKLLLDHLYFILGAAGIILGLLFYKHAIFYKKKAWRKFRQVTASVTATKNEKAASKSD